MHERSGSQTSWSGCVCKSIEMHSTLCLKHWSSRLVLFACSNGSSPIVRGKDLDVLKKTRIYTTFATKLCARWQAAQQQQPPASRRLARRLHKVPKAAPRAPRERRVLAMESSDRGYITTFPRVREAPRVGRRQTHRTHPGRHFGRPRRPAGRPPRPQTSRALAQTRPLRPTCTWSIPLR